MRFALKTLTPRLTDFFTDFEKKTTVLQSTIVAIALTARCGLPVLPHFPTRSLKQDSETCVGGKVLTENSGKLLISDND